jgi:hypothetical protein
MTSASPPPRPDAPPQRGGPGTASFIAGLVLTGVFIAFLVSNETAMFVFGVIVTVAVAAVVIAIEVLRRR